MRVSVIGDNDCARALRGLLRKAGFAVSDFMPGESTAGAPLFAPIFGYAVKIEEHRESHIHFDSIDCELEQNILKHVSQLSTRPVMVDRPGGVVHNDREIRILVPRNIREQQMAVEFGVLRGLIDTMGGPLVPVVPSPVPPWLRLRSWWKGLSRRFNLLMLLMVLIVPIYAQKEPIRNDPPVLTADQKFRIRDLQHRYDELRLQLAKVELDKVRLEKQASDALSSLNGLAFDLARESNIATDQWNLNIDDLKWERRKR